ncbi:hypothetical protein LPC08_18195 [Roseomonas sp. OT10]|uniref:hypothetical protein n=1 Tax=Roseomonas cutis TaxID=2897332 RepID=UPI001E2BF61A|nr:hypothetical protein [Roseomonas sp. OT10]UFN47928.1 hypothetical protein LPC08_18195 [Roseomonas sp. OT10]
MLARIRERLWKAQPREATFSLGPHTLTVDRDAWTLRLVRTFPPMSEGGGPAQQAAENIRLVLIECADAAEAGNLTDAHADGLNRVLADNLCLIAPEAAPPVLTLKAGRAE